LRRFQVLDAIFEQREVMHIDRGSK
jgi:hypothetical protein